MSFKDQMALDAAAIMDPVGGFAEWIVYAGERVKGIITNAQEKVKGNTFTSEGLSDKVIVFILESDVPDPKSGDVLYREDNTAIVWRVGRIMDTSGGMHQLECTTNESPWGR